MAARTTPQQAALSAAGEAIAMRPGTEGLGDMLETIAQGLVLVDPQRRIRAYNRRFVALLALNPEDIHTGQPFAQLLQKWADQTHQSAGTLRKAIQEIERQGNFVFEFSQRVQGERRWCQMFHNPLADGGFVRTFSDITEKRLAEETLRKERQLFETIMANMAQALVVVGPEGTVTHHNAAFRTIFPFAGWDSMLGRPFAGLVTRWAQECGKSERSLKRALERLTLAQPFTFEMSHQDGETVRWTVVHHNPLPDGGFVRTFTDITERKRLEGELIHVANTDSLTGLHNRRVFLHKLDSEIARARRYRHPLALLMIDLDHFKHINDSHGHAAGDEALRVFAALSRERLRNTDHVGRLGGEEFGVILPESDAAGALNMANRLLGAFSGTPIHPQCRASSFHCSFSGGLALLRPEDDGDSLLSRADHVLYRAKSGGRARIEAERPTD